MSKNKMARVPREPPHVSKKMRVAPLGATGTQPVSSPGYSSAAGKPYLPLADGTTSTGLASQDQRQQRQQQQQQHL
jgi:hypothetical protein